MKVRKFKRRKNNKLKELTLKDLNPLGFILNLKLFTIGVVVLAGFLIFATATFVVGFDEVEETKTRIETKEVSLEGPLEYTATDTAVVGFAAGGTTAVFHEIKVRNTDAVEGNFIVTSTIMNEGHKSTKTEESDIGAGEEYTFDIMHIRPWTDFESEYDITPADKSITMVQNQTVEYTETHREWNWPW